MLDTAIPHSNIIRRATTVYYVNNPSKREGAAGGTTPAKKKEHRKSEGASTARARALAAPKEPTFFIGGGNGVSLVESALSDIGWKRTMDKYNETYKLKWVECKSHINYLSFKEGDQLVNRIPNCHLLTNKLGLLNSLQRYERVQNAVNAGKYSRIRSDDFLPETYRVDDSSDRKVFLETFQDGELWICKPTGMNQGKGIYLVRDIEEFKRTMEERDEKKLKSHRPAMDRIVQRYIADPLLLEGRKFDIRAYMLIASTIPFLVLYHKGYVRLCLHEYDEREESLTAHLTNQFIQKKDSEYQNAKETTVWSMDKLNDYINEHVAEEKGVEQDWVYNALTNKMKQIMTYCFKAVQHKLKYKLGYFDLYGLDFMIDENMKVWLIEINVNPCLATNCEALKEVIPSVVRESIYLALECFEKQKRSKPIIPLESQQNCHIIYTESSKTYKSQNRSGAGGAGSTSPTRGVLPPVTPRSASPRIRSLSPINRSRSPVKDASSNNNNCGVLASSSTGKLAASATAPTFKASGPAPSPAAPERATTPKTFALQASLANSPLMKKIPRAPSPLRTSLPNIGRNSAGASRGVSASQEAIRLRMSHTMGLRRRENTTAAPASQPSSDAKGKGEKPERQTLALRTISAKYTTPETMDSGAALAPPTPANHAKRAPPPKPNLTGMKHPKSPNPAVQATHSISAALVPNTSVSSSKKQQHPVTTVLLTPNKAADITADLNRPVRKPNTIPLPKAAAVSSSPADDKKHAPVTTGSDAKKTTTTTSSVGQQPDTEVGKENAQTEQPAQPNPNKVNVRGS